MVFRTRYVSLTFNEFMSRQNYSGFASFHLSHNTPIKCLQDTSRASVTRDYRNPLSDANSPGSSAALKCQEREGSRPLFVIHSKSPSSPVAIRTYESQRNQ